MLWNHSRLPRSSSHQPGLQGWQATEDNLITLCHECHKYAPNDPDKFLAYQKHGGTRWARAIGENILDLASDEPNRTIKEVIDRMLALRDMTFEMSYRQVAEGWKECEE